MLGNLYRTCYPASSYFDWSNMTSLRFWGVFHYAKNLEKMNPQVNQRYR